MPRLLHFGEHQGDGLRALTGRCDHSAGQVSGHQIVGAYHDASKLRELVESCDVTTFDIEDIDTTTLMELEDQGHVIHPSPRVLAMVQDKLVQKRFLDSHGIPTSGFIDMPEPDGAVIASHLIRIADEAGGGAAGTRAIESYAAGIADVLRSAPARSS